MIPGLSLIEDQISFYNMRRAGNTFNAATILNGISNLGSIDCVAYLSKGLNDTITVWEIDQDITVPENIAILVPCGVLINVQLGITITFNGPCFNQCNNWHTGPGTIVLNNKSALDSQTYPDF